MWWGSGPDPGGSGGTDPPGEQSSTAHNQELTELKDQFEQQQVLIAQLKELLRKTDQSQSSPSLEKVEEYALTLSKMQSRAKINKSRKSEDTPTRPKSTTSKTSTPGKEKMDLLRKQLEENKVRMAERGKNQKGIEEMVIQLKAQLDDSQALVNQTILNTNTEDNRSAASLKTYSSETPAEELYYLLMDRDRSVAEFKEKIRSLEGNVLDLQENIKEKDSVIEARTKAITLMSEDLSRKGKSTLDMLDETKEQMRLMQENFVSLETNMREENNRLTEELDRKNVTILELENLNRALEKSKQELESENITNKQLLSQNEENMSKLTTSNAELQNKLTEMEQKQNLVVITENIQPEKSESVTAVKPKPKKDTKKVSKKSQTETDKNPETGIDINENEALKSQIEVLEKTVKDLETKLSEKNPETSKKSAGAKRSDDVEKLNKQLDEMNKNMIKVKAQNKAKVKELQKQVDAFKKTSDVNAELIRLQGENVKLGQKIAELEEEKGNLQLSLVDYDAVKSTDSQLNRTISELRTELDQRNKELSEHVQNINSLKTIKTDLENNLEDAQKNITSLESRISELSSLQNTQVSSEITTVELEEQLDKIRTEKRDLAEHLESFKHENNSLTEKIKTLTSEKSELNAKLENLIHENIELIDRLEKLSTEKVSSAESIEIVESLTQQEKMEIEEYNKKFSEPETEDHSTDLNESIAKLTEESAELMEKIELFTIERKEVMDKMDVLNSENVDLLSKLELIESEKNNLVETNNLLQNEKCLLEKEVSDLRGENEELVKKSEMIIEEKLALRDEYNILTQKLETANREIAESTTTKSDKESLNADVAYQDLRNKIQMYQTLIEEQKNQIEELQKQLRESANLKEFYNELLKSMETLKIEKDTIQAEKDTFSDRNLLLEQEILTLQSERKKLIEESDKLNEKLSTNDETSKELMMARDEIEILNENISQLERLSELEKDNKASIENDELITALTVETDELKAVISENVSQLQMYESEISKNTVMMESLNEELSKLNVRIENSEELLAMKDRERTDLENKLMSKEKELEDLKGHSSNKDREFKSIITNLQEKYQNLQSNLESNAGSMLEMRVPLEEKITELNAQIDHLESKSKEQLDKMKKLAANLKKKASACGELEKENAKLKSELSEKTASLQETGKELCSLRELVQNLNTQGEENEKLAASLKKKGSACGELEKENAKLKSELSEKTASLQETGKELCSLRELVQNLNTQAEESEKLARICETQKYQIEDLMKYNNEMNNKLNVTVSKQEYDRLIENLNTAKKDYEEILTKANDQLENMNKNVSIAHTKLDEQEMIIDSLEQEKTQYIDKISNLEELISKLEDDNFALNQKIPLLEYELQEKSTQLEIVNLNVDTLQEQLSALVAKSKTDKIRFDETLSEKSELVDQNKLLNKSINSLQQRLIENQESAHEILNEKIYSLESQNTKLASTISHLENELKRANHEYQKQIDRRRDEIENLESELSGQLQKLNEERKILIEERDYLSDLNKEWLEKEAVYVEKINYLSERYNEKSSELDSFQEETRKNISELISEKDTEIARLDRDRSELEIQYNKLLEEYNQVGLKLIQKSDTKEERRASLKDTAESEVSNIIWLAEEKVNTLEALKIEIEKLKNENQTLKEQLEVQKQTESIIEPTQTNYNMSTPSNTADRKSENLMSTRMYFESNTQPYLENLREAPTPSDSNTRQELEDKIKTLQFVLYDSDRSKEDALLLCQELSNEVARLVHEREKYNQKIYRQESIDESRRIDLESQIIPTGSIVSDAPDRPYVEIAERVLQQQSSQTDPVVEAPIEAKSTYVCYQDKEHEEIALGEDNFWGSAEARLEDAVQNNSKMIQLQERVNDLEMERERHLEEIKSLQVKSGKMIKKLKEFKARNDTLVSQLNTTSDEGFGELEIAIQEELKAQVSNLEKIVKELRTDAEKHSSERDNLKKKIDVLTAANERLVEMKEKQDIEIEVWQVKNKELDKKLELMEWNDDEFVTTKPTESKTEYEGDTKKFIEELTAKINDLATDNEELQVVLEEQYQLRAQAEQKLNSVKSNVEIDQLREDYNSLVSEKNKLTFSLNNLLEEKRELESRYKEICDEFDALKSQKFTSFQHQLEEESNILKSENAEMKRQFEMISEENCNLKEAQIKNSNITSSFEEQFGMLKNENAELKIQLETTLQENYTLRNTSEMAHSANDKIILERICVLLETVKDDVAEKLHKLIDEKKEIVKQHGSLLENFKQKSEECDVLTKAQTDEIQTKEILIKELENKVTALKNELEETRKQLEILNEEIRIERVEFDNKLAFNAEQWMQAVEQRGSDIAESWKLHVESRESEFAQIESHLKEQFNALESKYNALIANKSDSEVHEHELIHEKETMAREISKAHEKIAEFERDVEDLNSLINAKDVQIQNLSEECIRITGELQDNQSELDLVRKKNQEFTDELKIANEKVTGNEAEIRQLYAMIDSKDSEIRSIANESGLMKDTLSHHALEFENMKTVIDTKTSQVQEISREFTQSSEKISRLEYLLDEREAEINQLKEESMIKNDRISELMVLEEKAELSSELERELSLLREHSRGNEMQLKQDIYMKESLINDLNLQISRYAEIIQEKDMCISSTQNQLDNKILECNEMSENINEMSKFNDLSIQLQQQIENYTELIKNRDVELSNIKSILDEKNTECEELKYKMMELNTIVDEDSKQLSDLKDLIETQVLKIEELKQLLDIKNGEYERLVLYIEANVPSTSGDKIQTETIKSDVVISKQPESSINDDPAAFVRRAELDIALYMLHQRDVRCEELTVELMQLLEERDTLQLRLSNAIRINEELRRISPMKEPAEVSESVSQIKSQKPIGKSKSSQILLDASGTEMAKEATEMPIEDFADLENKLSQLHSMDYRRDVRLRDDQETRHLQQMSILQQHRDVAAMLPPEAAARLVNANYTVSRDVQSPSTVLLNWLWGRSTPRVNHI